MSGEHTYLELTTGEEWHPLPILALPRMQGTMTMYENGTTKVDIAAELDTWTIIPDFLEASHVSVSVDFEYFNFPVDLALNSDVPSIPERFRFVITDGAMYYAYMFRDNLEMATVSQRKFDEGVKQMRVLLVNENVYMRAV